MASGDVLFIAAGEQRAEAVAPMTLARLRTMARGARVALLFEELIAD